MDGSSDNGFQKADTKVDRIQAVLPDHLAHQPATTPVHKEVQATDQQEETPAHLELAHKEAQDMEAQLEFLPNLVDMEAQPLTQNQHQLAAPAIKDHQDPQALKDQLETQARMEITAKTVTTVKMLNCWLLNQLKFALFAHKAHQDQQEHQALKVHQARRDLLESHHVTVSQESKECLALQDLKVAQAVKDHAEPQANPVVSSQSQDHKDHLDNPDIKEKLARKDSRVQMDSHSKDHQDCQETQVPLEKKVAQEAQDLPAQLEKKAKRVLANTAHLHVLLRVINFQDESILLLHLCFLCLQPKMSTVFRHLANS